MNVCAVSVTSRPLMAASSTSMAGKKRHLADLSVEDFMTGGFDLESSSSESEKLAKGSQRAKKPVKVKKKKDTSIASHKKSLQTLQQQDPEFFEFLKGEDQSLLQFGSSDDDEDVSDLDEDEEDDDDDLEDASDESDDDDDDDMDIPSSSDSEDELSDKKKQKSKIEAKAAKTKAGGKAEGRQSQKEMKELAANILEDDDSDSDEDGGRHVGPVELEVASDSDESVDDEEDTPKKRPAKNRLTLKMVKDWTLRFKTGATPALIHDAVQAFKSAIQQTAAEGVKTKYVIEGSKVFNAVVRMCLVEMPPALMKLLDLPASTDLQKPVLPSQKNKQWKAVRLDVKTYLTDLLQLMSNLSQVDMVNVILKQIHRLVAYYACFPKLAKVMLKRVTVMWSSGEETSRVLAFLCINRLIHVLQDSLLETAVKGMYMAYVKNCKFTSPSTLPLINFMQRSLVEILALDFSLAYQYAFIYIRQLAIHLRNAITIKKKESCQAVYNWQYVHCLGLWVRLLSATHPNTMLEPLIFPLTQTIIGTIKLVPTQRYYPLRFHCCRALTILSKSTSTFIPVLPYLVEVFEQTDFNKKHKALSFKPFNFACMLKLSKPQLQEKEFRDGVIDQMYELLLEEFNAHAHTIGFPELTLPAMLQLKEFLKKCKVGNFCKQMKQIVDKVEENAKFITSRRRNTTISLADAKAIEAWERQCKEAGTPIGKFYTTWRKLRDRELLHRVANRDEIVDIDLNPAANEKPRAPAKATEKERREFSALFDSDSDEDKDHSSSLLPGVGESGSARKKRKTDQDSSSSEADEDDDDMDDSNAEVEEEEEEEEVDDDDSDEEEEDDGDEEEDDLTVARTKDIVKDFTFSSDEED